jgi:FolB domain-containing protein
MNDVIEIRDLNARCIIGVNDWEREELQEVVINISMFTDVREAGRTDDLSKSVNYRTVAKKVIELVEASKRFTVEALATDIARVCLKEGGVQRVRIRVEKPGALRFARSVGVEIEREAKDLA